MLLVFRKTPRSPWRHPMSAPTLTRDDLDLAALKNVRQLATNVLLSCGDAMTLDGVHEKDEVDECGDCGELVAIVQAFPVLDI
jgi:hypothetical protein